MSKVLNIKQVLIRMGRDGLQAAAEREARQARADRILEEIERGAEQRRMEKERSERAEILRLGYPEYQFVKNARRKAALRRRHDEFAEFERRRMKEKRRRRMEEKGYL